MDVNGIVEGESSDFFRDSIPRRSSTAAILKLSKGGQNGAGPWKLDQPKSKRESGRRPSNLKPRDKRYIASGSSRCSWRARAR